MDRIIIDVFEHDDDDVITTISPWELALTGDLTEQNDDDELGIRSLYERPEALLGPDGWPDAA